MAVDGSKFRAQNSKKNNYNDKKIDRHLEYIDKKTEGYLKEPDENDEKESAKKIEVKEKLEKLKGRKNEYKDLKNKLEESKELQISTAGPDAGALPKKMNIVEVSYNVQTATGAKHSLITDYEVTNENDTHALYDTAKKAKGFLEVKKINVLADKGYHTASELKKCAEEKTITYVAVKENAHSKKGPAFRKNKFTYNKRKDAYICPNKKELKSNGKYYAKKGGGKYPKGYKFKRYESPKSVCENCPFKEKCGPFSVGKGRYIERNENEKYVEENKKRVEKNKDKYRTRQQIAEHPFGTIKRGWGYDHVLLKTKEKVDGEFALAFTAYNLRGC